MSDLNIPTSALPIGPRAATRAFSALLAVMLAALVLFLASIDGLTRQDLPLDPTAPMMIRTLERHPASRATWERLSERALDYSYADRVQLWKTSHEMIEFLAASWPTARLGFLRGSFVHWRELDDVQRAEVVDSARSILARPDLFSRYWPLFWQSLHDIELLVQYAPPDPAIQGALADIAVSTGSHHVYQSIRNGLPEIVARDLERTRPSAETVISHLVSVPRTSAFHGVMLSQLAYLATNVPRKTAVDTSAIRSFVEYAIDHELGPLSGFREIALDRHTMEPPLLARYALAIGDDRLATITELSASDPYSAEWTHYRAERARRESDKGDIIEAASQLGFVRDENRQSPEILEAEAIVGEREGSATRKSVAEEQLLRLFGSFPGHADRWAELCGSEICRGSTRSKVFIPADTSHFLDVETIETDATAPWVEIWVDGSLVTEGAVSGTAHIEIPFEGWGIHDVEVRIANPRTRNLGRRVVAIAVEP